MTDLLDDEIQEILAVSQRRWEIEETFRIMKWTSQHDRYAYKEKTVLKHISSFAL